jgi:hypothetical protein
MNINFEYISTTGKNFNSVGRHLAKIFSFLIGVLFMGHPVYLERRGFNAFLYDTNSFLISFFKKSSFQIEVSLKCISTSLEFDR